MTAVANTAGVELELELERARALARRRIAWLRSTWPSTAGFAGLAVGHDEADRLAASVDHPQIADFLEQDPDAIAASEAVDAAASALVEWRVAGAPAPLAQLSSTLRLTVFEHDLLALAVCAEVDPGFARLCAYLQDDATRTHLSARLVLDLLAPSAGAMPPMAVSLSPQRPLRALALLHLEGDGAWAGRALRVDERVLAIVAGDDTLDPRVSAALEPLDATPLPERLDGLAQRAAELITAATQAGGPPVLALAGDATAPLHAVAAVAAARLRLQAVLVHRERLAGLEVEEAARLLRREAALGGLAYVLDEPLGPRWPDLGALVVIAAAEPPVDGIGARVDVATPTYVERADLLASVLGDHAVDRAAIVRTAGQFPLAPARLAEAVAAAQAEVTQDGVPLEDALWRACRVRSRRRAPGLAAIIEPRRTWDDLVLPTSLLGRLQELCSQVDRRAMVYEQWGFGARLGRGRGITALFAGSSGTGKTLAAEVLAHSLGVDLQRIDLAGVVDKYIGETEKHLRAVFDAAEQSGALLFFDEADALFGKRTDVRDSHDRYANIEVDYLLQRMEDYPGLAVLATNRRSALDTAFMRRLRFVLDFPFPDAASRETIWATAFPPEAPAAGLDLHALARLELSGGSIATVAVNAAFAAAADGSDITMRHLAASARAELTKLERLVRDDELERILGLTP